MTTDQRRDPAEIAGEMAEERGLVTATVVAPPTTQIAIFGTDDPTAIAQRVIAIAGPLAEFIKQKHMSTTISGREYVLAEGWSFAGTLLGVFPRTSRVTAIEGGYEAEVELVANGQVVGSAIAECTRAERTWANRDGYALKSMAQTRAMGKVFRMVLGFVVKAAGFEVTPAEEMPAPRAVPASQKATPQKPDEALDLSTIKTVGHVMALANRCAMDRDQLGDLLDGITIPGGIAEYGVEAAAVAIAGSAGIELVETASD